MFLAIGLQECFGSWLALGCNVLSLHAWFFDRGSSHESIKVVQQVDVNEAL